VNTSSVTGITKLYALIGHPIEQVRTPTVLNSYLGAHGINAVMVAFDLLPSAIDSFFDVLRGLENCLGCCVTIPHKKIAFELVDKTTDRSNRIGAVNIIRRENNGTLVGDMTDGAGFIAALKTHGTSVKGKHVVLVGGGGAGGAIADSVALEGANRLSIIEINKPRFQDLVSNLRIHYPDTVLDDNPGDPANIEILVNASPLGMDQNDPLPFSLEGIPSETIVADVVTKPNVTKFLELANEAGNIIQKGHEMAEAQMPMFIDFLGMPDTNNS